MTKATVYYTTRTEGGHNVKHTAVYPDVIAVKAGTARQVLGADAAGNGIPDNAPVIQLVLSTNETATFDADNVTILF